MKNKTMQLGLSLHWLLMQRGDQRPVEDVKCQI